MPIISFWGTEDSAQLATTATIGAVAAMLPTKYTYKTLLTQTHYSDMSLESAFFDMDKLGNKGRLDIADTGVDALDRLLRSNKLTPENISNYAKSIAKGRLELLYGSFKNDMDSYSRILETFPLIIDYASQFYDIVLVDLNKKITVDRETFVSKGKNTPFHGKSYYGEVKVTIKGGKVVYNNLV